MQYLKTFFRRPLELSRSHTRRGGRAAECRLLESARGETLRGFKSLPRRTREGSGTGNSLRPGTFTLSGPSLFYGFSQDTLGRMLRLAFLIVIDIVVVAGISIGVGVTAPRWRGQWLTRDFGPLHLAPWETPKFFRALKTRKLAKRLPELGSAFGGKAKSELPGRDAEQIDLYLIELRRAEWVHWVSLFSWVPLAFFNPWYLTLLFMVIQISGNISFFLILRANRLRLVQIRQRLA